MGLVSSLRTAARLVVTDPGRLLRRARWRYHRWAVFSARLADLPAPGGVPGFELRRLSAAEVLALAPLDEEIAEGLHRCAPFADRAAWGAWVNGEFAHMAWLLDSTTEPQQEEPVLIRLRPAEVEITYCVTLPAFRGRGIYPELIRALAAKAAETGARDLIMITETKNVASQRGILKAGLRRCPGDIYWARLLGVAATIRAFRWRQSSG
jgi:GNAT superfamily N-acetyltransferase